MLDNAVRSIGTINIIKYIYYFTSNNAKINMRQGAEPKYSTYFKKLIIVNIFL